MLINYILGIYYNRLKLSKYSIENYFFLDQAFPSLYKVSRLFPSKCAVRVSDVESSQTALSLKPGWVWLDSHSGDWSYLLESIKVVRELGMKIFFVSQNSTVIRKLNPKKICSLTT